MNKSTIERVISFILLRTHTVDDVLRAFDKYQTKLVQLSARLREAAAKEEARAQEILDKAKAKSAEAERAISVASKFADLTK